MALGRSPSIYIKSSFGSNPHSRFNPHIDQTIKLAVKSVNNIRRVHHLLSSSDFPRLREHACALPRITQINMNLSAAFVIMTC